jgi:hypothetical protein
MDCQPPGRRSLHPCGSVQGAASLTPPPLPSPVLDVGFAEICFLAERVRDWYCEKLLHPFKVQCHGDCQFEERGE